MALTATCCGQLLCASSSGRKGILKQETLDALDFSLAVYEQKPQAIAITSSSSLEKPAKLLDIIYWDEDEHFKRHKKGPEPILIGRSSMHGHIIVACRGTASFADLVSDLKFPHKPLSYVTGSAHAGFAHRADCVNIEPFVALVQSGKKVIFTGHSLGGAVASLVALRVLKEAGISGCCKEKNFVQVITFGSPLFADPDLAELVNNEYREQFHHVVSKNDLVPKILPLMTFAHRLLGGETAHMELLRLSRKSFGVLENVTGFPLTSFLCFFEGLIPRPLKSIVRIALRLFWPSRTEHQFAFAGQIMMIDKCEKAMGKAFRLTRAEELNFWFRQLFFGLSLNFGAFAEHSLLNYATALQRLPSETFEASNIPLEIQKSMLAHHSGLTQSQPYLKSKACQCYRKAKKVLQKSGNLAIAIGNQVIRLGFVGICVGVSRHLRADKMFFVFSALRLVVVANPFF